MTGHEIIHIAIQNPGTLTSKTLKEILASMGVLANMRVQYRLDQVSTWTPLKDGRFLFGKMHLLIEMDKQEIAVKIIDEINKRKKRALEKILVVDNDIEQTNHFAAELTKLGYSSCNHE